MVKSLDVDKIQAHLWNSVAGINVGMGYFFYFVGAKFCEAVGMRTKMDARGQGGRILSHFPVIPFGELRWHFVME